MFYVDIHTKITYNMSCCDKLYKFMKERVLMKKFKSGFTLAEVMITLGIIGVIAAIILPSVMSNYQYKSVGVKLAKFLSTTEGAARAYSVNDGNFTSASKEENITAFINDTYIFKSFEPEVAADKNTKILSYPSVTTNTASAGGKYTRMSGSTTSPIGVLKDGTSVQVFADATTYASDRLEIVPVEKYGMPIFRIEFDPRIQGLPNTAHKNFSFTVTELGYVFPSPNDDCTWALFENDFKTTSKDFATGTSCHTATKK